ncbi:uncharacterized protein [Aristolochia californica]|uniref:uncharacterized protein n=1 Tax=Aristolochia californica TaxID=171875 RepID=UPI0035D8B437
MTTMLSFPYGGECAKSAVGDPGMKRDSLRLALESWNQCNEVGEEVPFQGSPRAADCFDVLSELSDDKDDKSMMHSIIHRVTEEDNKLGVGDPFLGVPPEALHDVDLYAPAKEAYLGYQCQVNEYPHPWQFWMIMLKSGNMDVFAGLCPENGKKIGPFGPSTRFPCFGPGCMNHPIIFHNYTSMQGDNVTLQGSFYGTYDLDANRRVNLESQNISYYSVVWEKEIGKGSWVFHHKLRTSVKYPWLMLYLRSDATKGLSGGYHYPTRGMSKIIPESPNFKVRHTLNVLKGGGPQSQFYLLDMGSCWKNDGRPCDGDVLTDVTRYSELIINPAVTPWCRADNLHVCPPYHTFPNGTRVHRTDKANYPYSAYHVHCSPGNAQDLEEPYNLCDPYSNPQAQEILQILPHPVWGDYGYPTKAGEGWIGDGRTWELDVGRLSRDLYFYQDPGTPPAKRIWPSINVGTEIYISAESAVAEWTLSDFDIIITDPEHSNILS